MSSRRARSRRALIDTEVPRVATRDGWSREPLRARPVALGAGSRASGSVAATALRVPHESFLPPAIHVTEFVADVDGLSPQQRPIGVEHRLTGLSVTVLGAPNARSRG